MIIRELFEIIFNYLNLQMNYAPNFELRTGSCFKFPIAWWWRSVYISSNLFCWRLHEVWRSVYIRSNLFCSRLHGVPSDVLLVLWWRNARDVSNSDLQWSHLKGRNCWVDTLWLFCLFIDGILSDSSACSLHCMAPGLSKIFSQVKLKRTQNIQKYSQRARERDSFPNISYSTEISADRWCLNMKCGSSHDSWKFIFGEKEDQEIWKKTIQDSIDLKFSMQIM